jgi:hypothetical protein
MKMVKTFTTRCFEAKGNFDIPTMFQSMTHLTIDIKYNRRLLITPHPKVRKAVRKCLLKVSMKYKMREFVALPI